MARDIGLRSIHSQTRPEDTRLVERLQSGDAGAIEVLVSEYGGRVYRLARGITRSDSDAEEIVQDVFLTIATKGASFKGRSSLGTWIYRITTNVALNKRRGKRREVESSLEEQLLPTFEADGRRAGDRTFLLADWSQDPERELLAGETRRILDRALDGLPANYRAVLVLRDVEELTNEEVADALDESVGAVKARLHRARMVLREHVARTLPRH